MHISICIRGSLENEEVNFSPFLSIMLHNSNELLWRSFEDKGWYLCCFYFSSLFSTRLEKCGHWAAIRNAFWSLVIGSGGIKVPAFFCMDARLGILTLTSGVCHGESEIGAGSVLSCHISFVLLQDCLTPIWIYWGKLVDQLGKLFAVSNWILTE